MKIRLPSPRLWLFLPLLLAACASTPDPTRVEGRVTAADQVNPGAGVQSAPVVVRIYALSAASPFDGQDFFTLYEEDRQALGETLLYREERQLNPGDTWPLTLSLPANAAYLGVIAAFRTMDQAQWRRLVPLRPGKTNRVTVRLEGNRIQIEGQ